MKSGKPKNTETASGGQTSGPFPVVGIGASAGGLDAFKKLLKALPVDSGMAFILVQHLNPDHESLLPEILQKVTMIPVIEITEKIDVQPDHIYIIPGNKLLMAKGDSLQLLPRLPKDKNKVILPIDHCFISLAEVYQNYAIGVVLSGTASDGTLGLKAIKDYGGITFAQDEESAAFEGMPHSAVQSGHVDFVLPPEKIPQKLAEVLSITLETIGESRSSHQQDEEAFRQILSLLRARKGTDFTYYKQTTIHRRILRRMALNKYDKSAMYYKFLRENNSEQDVLYQDLLIPVTSFFRDPKSFENLSKYVFPLIAKNNISGEPIRIWVAGCSTGEEAYSIAICLKEFAATKNKNIQIFATDISEPAIAKARAGIYVKTQLGMLTPLQLQDFFIKTDSGYQVKKQIREMCIFAVHNFLKDPPFGRMDLISCRNVLIYMDPYLQKKSLTTFHYSLKPGGFLLLGKSETPGVVTDLFSLVTKQDKLFVRRDVPGKVIVVATQRNEQNFLESNVNPKVEIMRTDFQKTADDIILSKFTPSGVVVNDALDIVYFRGTTANFLEQSPGKPTHNLLKMAKPGLSFELRNILHKTKRENGPVSKENIPIEIAGREHRITIEAIPIPNVIERHFLIVFRETQNPDFRTPGLKSSSKLMRDQKEARIKQLEAELAQSREDMRSIVEDQEAVNEELQSVNEELLSGSEELQSLNEELETGKEELQSTNEELLVTNTELNSLNEQLAAARNFSEAIVASLHEPLIVLDSKLRIKTTNDAFKKKFLLSPAETEGKLIYELADTGWDAPKLRLLLENVLPEKSQLSDFEINLTFSKVGTRTLLLNVRELVKEGGSERLILVAIEDITESVRTRNSLLDQNKALEILNKKLESFAHISSHDLQEPLRKIQYFSTLIQEKENQGISVKGHEYFGKIKDSTERMQKLIEDLLSFSEVSNTQIKIRSIDFSKAVAEVKREMKDLIEEKQAIIETNSTCRIKVIPFQLKQLLINIIGNGIKFQPPGNKPHIILSCTYLKIGAIHNKNLLPGKEYWHIMIKDNGIGFEQEYNEKIFEIFERLHPGNEFSGTGIGLSIVKKIVENHNGFITAKGELNKGSTFDIYLPQS